MSRTAWSDVADALGLVVVLTERGDERSEVPNDPPAALDNEPLNLQVDGDPFFASLSQVRPKSETAKSPGRCRTPRAS